MLGKNDYEIKLKRVEVNKKLKVQEANPIVKQVNDCVIKVIGCATNASRYANEASACARYTKAYANEANSYARKSISYANEASACARDVNAYGNEANGYARKSNTYAKEASACAKGKIGLVFIILVFLE